MRSDTQGGLTLLGAITARLAATFVFVLNMTSDVPLKLCSLHLVVMSLVLQAQTAAIVATSYASNIGSDVRIVSSSICACAMSSRSKGSR